MTKYRTTTFLLLAMMDPLDLFNLGDSAKQRFVNHFDHQHHVTFKVSEITLTFNKSSSPRLHTFHGTRLFVICFNKQWNTFPNKLASDCGPRQLLRGSRFAFYCNSAMSAVIHQKFADVCSTTEERVLQPNEMKNLMNTSAPKLQYCFPSKDIKSFKQGWGCWV